MRDIIIYTLFGFFAVCTASAFYLVHHLLHERRFISLVGLFCLAMGFFLLLLDIVLITVIHGALYIPDYLLFKRLVSDSGFAGRFVLTGYVFACIGLIISIYLLASNMISKFNKTNSNL